VWSDDEGRHLPAPGGIKFDRDPETGFFELSTYVEEFLSERGLGPFHVSLRGEPPQHHPVFMILAGTVREMGTTVTHTPDDETPINFAHASVRRPDLPDKEWRRWRTHLAKAMTCILNEPDIPRPPQERGP
jgi:hypothetical protein